MTARVTVRRRQELRAFWAGRLRQAYGTVLYHPTRRGPVLFLGSIGELHEDELAKLRSQAEEARPRIGTGHKRSGSGGVDRADRRRVKLWAAVQGLRTDDDPRSR